MRILRTSFLLTALVATVPARAQSVSSTQGNVFFRDARGHIRQLTHSKRDQAPTLSPDKKRVAFLRTAPGEKLWSPRADVDPQEMWIVDIDGKHARRLVSTVGGKADPGELPGPGWKIYTHLYLVDLYGLQFSLNGNELFFGWGCAAVNGCLNKVDLRTGHVRLLGGYSEYEVLREGGHAGYLLVTQHTYYPEGGSYEELWLMDPAGKLVRDVGSGDPFDEAVRQFKAVDARSGSSERK